MRPVYETYMVTEAVVGVFGVNEIKLEHLFLGIMVVNLGINQRPQWTEDLQLTRKGLAVEEYIPAVQERMFDGFTIDFGNLDTKAFVGQGIANERVKWDASIAIDMVVVFSKRAKSSWKGNRDRRRDDGPTNAPCGILIDRSQNCASPTSSP